MGLDITAHRQLTLAPYAPVDEDGDPVDWKKHIRIHGGVVSLTEGNWPGRTAPVVGGIYVAGETFGFPCGAYSSYNRWREWLSMAAGHGMPSMIWEAANPTGPFVELIDFSDCEGVIGSMVAAKLAKDFADNESRIIGAAPYGGHADMYRQWRKAFEMAADGGCVVFH